MRDLILSLEDADLSRYARTIGSIIQNADLWLLGVVVAFLVCLGHKMAIGHRVVYGWGLRLAALTVLGYGGYTVWQLEDVNDAMSPAVVFRVAAIAGGVLAASWILLPLILFVYVNFRFGLVGFVGYVSYALVAGDAMNAESLPGTAARGLLVAGLAMVLAWVLRPIWEFVARHWPVQPPAPAQTAPVATLAEPAAKPHEGQPRLPRSERRRRRLARLQALEAELAAARARMEAPSAEEVESRRRRSKARLEAESAYFLAAPHLGNELPRELFERWMAQYLGDGLSVEEVEENSRHLQKLLREQLQASEANPIMEEVHFWFAEEQRRIEALDLDPAERQAKLLASQELYIALSQRFRAKPAAWVVPMLAARPPEVMSESIPYAEVASAGK